MTRPIYLTLIVLYVVLCALWGSSSTAPIFIRSWSLFDWWVTPSNQYQDIRYRLANDPEGEYQFVLKTAPYLQSVKVDTVTLANLLLKRFDYEKHDLEDAIQKLKERCKCSDLELVEFSGLSSDHILYGRSSNFRVVRRL